jgi:hypothetical protein
VKEPASLDAAWGTLLALPSSDTRKLFCAAAWAPAENDGSWEFMFASLRKAFAPANVTPALRRLDRCAAGVMLVRSVAPLVREANARAKDLVILHESDVGTSLDVIHSIFAGLNSDSSHRGRQRIVSPSKERLRLVVGEIRMGTLLFNYDPPFRRLAYDYPIIRRTSDSV